MKNELDIYNKIEAAYHDMRSTSNDKRSNTLTNGKLLSHTLAEKLIALSNSTPNGENILLDIADLGRSLHYKPFPVNKKLEIEEFAEAAS